MLNIKIIKLPTERWPEYKALRLEALKNEPISYANSHEESLEHPDEKWQKLLEEGNTWFAEVDGKLVGMASVDRSSKLKVKHHASIVAVYVSPDFRGKGLARKLLETILKSLEEDPEIVKVDLDVTTTLEPAIHLYESLGFKIVGTYEKEYKINGKYYDLYEMEKIFTEKL